MDVINTAMALNYLGADVESALLTLSATSPTLDARVRSHLFFDMRIPRIICILDKHLFVDRSRDYPSVRIRNAIVEILRFVDGESVKTYLLNTFPEYDLKVLYG